MNKLICKSKDPSFWSEVKSQKNIQTKEEIAFRKEELQSNAQRQKTITDLLKSVYEDKVHGTIDDETFALLVNSYRKESNELRNREQHLQTKLDILQNEQNRMLLFQKMLIEQKKIDNLTRDILGRFVDWIAIYPADRSTKPYRQKMEIHYHFIGKLKKSFYS